MLKVLALAVLAVVAFSSAQTPTTGSVPASGPVITPYGMAQYRLRYEIIDSVPPSPSQSYMSNTYSNWIGYKMGVKAQMNKEFSMQLEIGNDWAYTDGVNDSVYTYSKRDLSMTPWFSLAYAQWDPGYMHILAGIVPTRETAIYDLLGNSLLFNKKYTYASQVPWAVITNSGMPGLKAGAPILNGQFKLGVDLMTSIIDSRTMKLIPSDDFKSSRSAAGLMLDVPMSIMALSLTPQFIYISDRSYNPTTGKGDPEIIGGLDAGYKLSPTVTFRAGFGYATNGTKDVSAIDTEEVGMNGNIGTTMIVGPGKFDLDLNYSTNENTQQSDSKISYQFVDLKYSLNLNKYFVVTPRVRWFSNTYASSDLLYWKLRPELIFTGAF